MMKPLLFTLFSQGQLIENICSKFDSQLEAINFHEFPDYETSVQINSNIKNCSCIIFETFHHPNNKILPLIFLAETMRDLGAKDIGLIAPYLAYMRQDKRFHPGEGITSRYFAKLITNYFDWVITVDPHLHRIHHLQDLYTIPASVMHATKNIAQWIKLNIDNPILIGPDIESKQWVIEIAKEVNAPFLILEKIRHGDRDIKITIPEIERYKTHTPVLVDDIISTAKTMVETIIHLKKLNNHPPICIGIHGIFAGSAYDDLLKAGASKIITCNTIPHFTNQIDLSDIIFDKLMENNKI